MRTVGKLTDPDLKITDAQWIDNVKRFWVLRWAEVEMVGDEGIRQAMRRVQQQIIETEDPRQPTRDRHDLRWATECLADELRFALEHAWQIKRDTKRVTAAGDEASKLPAGCSGTHFDERLDGMAALTADRNAKDILAARRPPRLPQSPIR